MTAAKKAGRKPAHLMAAGPKPQGRDAIWAEIRKQVIFTYRSLREATDIPDKTIRDYVAGLIAAKIVEEKMRKFLLVRDQGVHAPRVRKDGSEVTQGRATEAMWTAMRLLKQFSPRDLALHASTEAAPVKEVHAKDYCHHLAKARYLRIIKPSQLGRQAVYFFVNFTGPKAPMVQRVKQVFDPNTGKVMWPLDREDGQ